MAKPQEVQIVAEMVANVISIEVAPGDPVSVGDTVIWLESMKMEIPVIAEHAGTVGGIFITPGDVVQEGDVMLSFTL
ncbi:MAG: biotin/lipoyl-binding carrier protein [Nocardioides sp.]